MAVRLLEQRNITHDLLAFDPAIRDAGQVADALGAAHELVYKTLVIEQDPPKGKPYIAMVPASSEVNLRALAAALGVKKLRMASHRDAERQTGLQVGGIGALALTGKGFPVLIDVRAFAHEAILVSAGQRGYDIRIAVKDLLALTEARPVLIAT